ncbi:MAG TPA: hypothetical protein VIJ16_08045, partial [Gemmatimonadaceae bacterium]
GGRGGFGGFGRGAGPDYPAPGAQIDYYLGSAPSGDISLEILDATGKVVQKFSSAAPSGGAEGRGGRGGGRGGRGGAPRLDATVGMHRFTWDLRYPGAWASAARPDGGDGPTAVPGKYSARLTVGSYSSTQPFTLIEDPRATKDGITTADLRTQFQHNERVLVLVSGVNQLVARVEAAQRRLNGATGAAADTLAKMNDLADALITPAIRYSKPALQTHIQYLYSMTNMADQIISSDAVERYAVLKKELEQRVKEADAILGTAKQ